MGALLAGLIAAVGAYLLKRRWSRRIQAGAGDGTLFFGPSLRGYGMLALIGALAVGALAWAGELAPVNAIGAGSVLLLAGLVCLGGAARVHGVVDDSGILLAGLWGGQRDELWRDLRRAHYSALTCCYVLTFASGRTLRISAFLSGHGAVLEQLRARGCKL